MDYELWIYFCNFAKLTRKNKYHIIKNVNFE